ncbi:MAG: cytochrome c biogenesis protein ResB [Nibricoccus sp.]
MNDFYKSVVHFFVSLKLTVVLLAFSIVLVFVATIDQVHLGIWAVQQEYFRSFVARWRIPIGDDFKLVVPLPGGYLVGGLLFINLVASHLYRFKLSWKKSGIFLTHFGLIFLLLGELLSGLWQEDFQMRLDEGQTSNYSESSRFSELAFIDTSDPKTDTVVAIPETLLEKGRPIQTPSLPFRVNIRAYYPNATLQMRNQMTNPPPALATQGLGADVAVIPQEITYKPNERNLPAAAVELVGTNGSLGTWLVSSMIGEAQTFTHEGKTWRVVLRDERYYKPFSLTLLKFSHDRYAGTDIPKNFSSRIRLKTDDGKTDREALIYMNNPLRFAGLTFYQAGFDNNDRTTVLQVVRNPGRALPYVACILMAAGLLIQFGISLYSFISKRAAAKS